MKEGLEEHIEAFVDDEVSADLRSQIEMRIEKDEQFAKQVDLAFSIKSSLSEQERYTAPSSIERAVLKEIKSRRRSQKVEASGSWWSGRSWPGRAVLQVASLVAIAVLMGYWILPKSQTPETIEFSALEIDQAEEDIKWVMAFVSDTGLQTGHMVRDDVIAKRVVVPMKAQIRTSIIN